MKKIQLLLCFQLVAIFSLAQTQQGYVKTKGRLGNNGAVIKGTRLSGAMVTVKGRNAVVSGNDGNFELNIPDGNYVLQDVQKKGYVITDPEMLSRKYTYSKNPLVLVLESQEQQTDDRLQIERKIRRSLRDQLKKREDEIEALKEKNKITKQDYQEQLQKLFNDQKSNEKLINEMVNRYSKIDYDLIDKFNTKISKYILDGELLKADSLLNTKGDINARTVKVRNLIEHNAKVEADLLKRQEKLEKNIELAQKELEDIAQDCYSKFEICKIRHQNDSATYYIEFRAELDTTNIEWQFDVAIYLYAQKQLKESELYYRKILNLCYQNKLENLKDIARALNDLALIYSKTQRFSDAESMFKEALDIRRSQASANPNVLNPYIAQILNNLAGHYMSINNYLEAERWAKEGVEYYKRLSSENPQLYEGDLAKSFHNLALLYTYTKRYPDAELLFKDALEVYQHMSTTNSESHEADLAQMLNNFGALYYKINNYIEAESMYKKALVIRKHLASDNPQSYESDVAETLNQLAGLYLLLQRDTESETMFKESLDIRRRLAKKYPNAYDIYVAKTLNNMSVLYFKTDRLVEAEAICTELLDIYHRLSISNPGIYDSNISKVTFLLAQIYQQSHRYDEAEESYKQTLDIRKRLAATNMQAYEPDVAITLYNLGKMYSDINKKTDAKKNINEALGIYKSLVKTNPQYYQPIADEIKKFLKLLK